MSEYDVTIERKEEAKLYFNLCDHRGRPTRAKGSFRMTQFPQLALKMQQGDTQHSDREPPYATREQVDFSGGRGWDDFEREKTRFYDSYRAQTWHEGLVLLGPEETYAEGIRPYHEQYWWNDNEDANDDIVRINLEDDPEYYSIAFTPTANFTPKYVQIAFGLDCNVGWWELSASIYSDNAGEPNASLFTTGALTPDAYDHIETFEFISPVQLNNGTKYHLVIRNEDPSLSATEGYYVAGSASVSTKDVFESDQAVTWSGGTYGIFFRLLPDDKDFDMFSFEHLGAFYVALSFRDGSNPEIYRNGERGQATSGTSTTIVDSGAAWTVNALTDQIVLLYAGQGSDVDKPWRIITSNTGTAITVPAWDETPDETTKYVVMKTNVFTEVTGHGMTGKITDVFSFGNVVYFCRGDFFDIFHMYDDTFAIEEGNRGTFMISAPCSTDDSTKIYLARASYPPTMYTATPEFADDGWTLQNLIFTEDVVVGDASGEANDASWADVGVPILNVQDNSPRIDGSWSRAIQAAAGNVGAGQTITVINGGRYRIEGWIYNYGANDVKIEFDGSEVGAVTTQDTWVFVYGYEIATGAAVTLEILAKGGAANFNFDAIKVIRVDQPLPSGHNRITNLVVAGSPKRLYIMTDAGILKEDEGSFVDVMPGEFKNVKDYRNGRVAIDKGDYIYASFLNNVVKFYNEEISIIGPNIDLGLKENMRGEIGDMISYGDWLLVAIDGGDDNISSILLYNGLGWHEYYRAPAAGFRITDLHIQSMPENHIDRLWFNEGGDIVMLPIDMQPLMNSDFRYTFAGWIDQATIFGSMGEVEKFFQSIKVTSDQNSSDKYITVKPRDVEGYSCGSSVPAGESWESLWGTLTESPMDENSIEEFWSMATFTLRRLQVHIGLHNTRPTYTPDLRSIVVDFLEHIPVGWSYTFRLVTADSRRSLTGERANDAIEDDIATLLGYCNSAEPIRIQTPFSYADDFQAKLISLTDLEPIGHLRGSDRERTMFVMTVVDA